MAEGIIVKGISGFYYVKCKNKIYTCKAKGSFRNKNNTPYVGDYVTIREIDEDEGFIEEIRERKNFLIRPPVSNIDRMIIISSVLDPKPDTVFIDKMTAICEFNNIEPVLCFNKTDLTEDLSIISEYEKIGYKVLRTSVKEGIGLIDFRSLLVKGITAVAGFSGVGKSSLINTVVTEDVKTGQISDKILRGKHTTRHVELFEVSVGKYFADTPGFSSLDIDMIRKEELDDLFVEFKPYLSECRFNNCSHTKERDCGVISAVKENKIAMSRYENYNMFYEKLKLINDWEREK